jgi:hypothetical protein
MPIIDVSISMWNELKDVKRHLFAFVDLIPNGDRFSGAWFSSENGEFGWITKGFGINGLPDRDALKRMIDKHLHTHGTTCFSEVLGSTPQVLEDTEVLNMPVNFSFLSDGDPVVWRHSRETELSRAEEALKRIQPKVVSALVVGYGPYYRRENLTRFARALNGQFLHADDLDVYNMALQTTLKTTQGLDGKVSVKLAVEPHNGIVFRLVDGQIQMLDVDDNKVEFAPKADGDNIYILTAADAIVHDGKEQIETFELDYVSHPGAETNGGGGLLPAIYAAAKTATTLGDQQLGLELLAALGDVRLVNELDSALTVTELGTAEGLIEEAIKYPARRFIEGRKPGQLPPDNKFSFLDAVTALQNDPEAYFYPTNPNFKYTAITRGADYAVGYPKMKRDPAAHAKVSEFTWNSELLNLSIARVYIGGHVELLDRVKINPGTPEETFVNCDAAEHDKLTGATVVTPEGVGLPRVYPVHIFRTYAFVFNGAMRNARMPLSMSEKTFKLFKRPGIGIIKRSETWEEHKIFLCRFEHLKVTNRAAAQGKTSARELAELYWQDLQFKGQVKILKGLLDELDPDKALRQAPSPLTADQEKFLKANGIERDGKYAPPKKEAPPKDYYVAYTFLIKPKGLSDGTLPNLKELRKKLADIDRGAPRAKIKLGEKVGKSGLVMYEQAFSEEGTVADRISWLRDTIAAIKGQQNQLRNDIAARKINIVLNRLWFDEAASRADNSFAWPDVAEGVEFTFVVDNRNEEF